jgi:hypothetical protein
VADTVKVVFAVYGALADGWFNQQDGSSVRRMYSQAGDVRGTLQTLLNGTSNNVVTINNANMGGDPAVGFDKHFGAIVEYKEQLRAYACQEGQTIDFSQQTARLLEGDLAATGTVKVVYAVFGALDGNQVARARDVKKALQTLLNGTPPNNVVTINDKSMGGDPAVGLVKHFGAYVEVGSHQPVATLYFACQEGQTIDFSDIYGPVLETLPTR